MTPAAAGADPQTSLYETTIDDPELEALLEDRARKKDAAARARKQADAAHETVTERIEKLDLADGPVRIGKWVVAVVPTSPRSVAFETAAGERIRIKPLPEADS